MERRFGHDTRLVFGRGGCFLSYTRHMVCLSDHEEGGRTMRRTGPVASDLLRRPWRRGGGRKGGPDRWISSQSSLPGKTQNTFWRRESGKGTQKRSWPRPFVYNSGVEQWDAWMVSPFPFPWDGACSEERVPCMTWLEDKRRGGKQKTVGQVRNYQTAYDVIHIGCKLASVSQAKV